MDRATLLALRMMFQDMSDSIRSAWEASGDDDLFWEMNGINACVAKISLLLREEESKNGTTNL